MQEKWQQIKLSQSNDPIEEAEKVIFKIYGQITELELQLNKCDSKFANFEMIANEMKGPSKKDYADSVYDFDFVLEDRG